MKIHKCLLEKKNAEICNKKDKKVDNHFTNTENVEKCSIGTETVV